MSVIEIVEFVEEAKENEYTSTIQDLIATDEANGKLNAVRITVPTKDKQKTHFKVSKAANNLERTARLRNETISEDGENVTMTFTLTNKHKARRRKGDRKNADALNDGTVVEENDGTLSNVDGAEENDENLAPVENENADSDENAGENTNRRGRGRKVADEVGV